MDSKDGLVARVWSDSGDVTVGEVTELRFADLDLPYVRTIGVVRCYGNFDWSHYVGMRDVGVIYHDGRLVWSAADSSSVKPSDPNAKPALPALTRVGGNKRGPGWCDEGGK